MEQSHSLGKEGEDMAAEYLREKGCLILERNWATGHREIDIIAEDDEYIIFVEVKTRGPDYRLHPRDAVSVPKQRNIIHVAQVYILSHKCEKEARFDIISIITDGNKHSLEHIKDAFYPSL